MSQSPSNRGNLSQSSAFTRARQTTRPSQSPSNRGNLSQGGSRSAVGIGPAKSQSPSNRGNLSQKSELKHDWVARDQSQSPSNRGNLSQAYFDEVRATISDCLNPLLIGGTFLSVKSLELQSSASDSLNPLLIGGTFLRDLGGNWQPFTVAPSQSPSNRGNLSQRLNGCAGSFSSSPCLNPLLIGGTFLSFQLDHADDGEARRLNPLLIGGTFLR